MLKDAHRLTMLIKAYIDDKISDNDKAELESWLSESPRNLAFFNRITDKEYLERELEVYDSFDPDAAFQRYSDRKESGKEAVSISFHRRKGVRLAALTIAAAVLAGVVVTLWPVGEVENSRIATVRKATLFETISVPEGDMRQFTLPDGSLVWLNAGSSVRYLRNFSNALREVEVTGEAYFEVAADAKRPFVAKVGTLRIDVLGTHFNVKAYPDEKRIITLLEGKVNVSKDGASAVLTKGMQAEIPAKREVSAIEVKEVDERSVIAWKNNDFNFDQVDLQQVLNDIGRWYNVEFVYEGRQPAITFSAVIDRSKPLTVFLDAFRGKGLVVENKGDKIFIR